MTTDWKPKLKSYPHFDKYLPEEKIIQIVTDPLAVAQNKFYPFMLFHESNMRFGKTKQERNGKSRPSKKPRPIRYAARRDSYIFSYYRHLLSERYEDRLDDLQLNECVTAYRKIPVGENSKTGKCNIHFARDAFEEIRRRGECVAIALDISDFFGSINHERLGSLWLSLMGHSEWKPDHQAVFKAITKYADVPYYEALERLGYWGSVTIKGIEKKGYLLQRTTIPMQLCSPKDFREKICGDHPQYSKLVIKDKNRICGIPQGSPMSDLLANLYLLEFDAKINAYAKANNAYYRRYSDDILIICPNNHVVMCNLLRNVNDEIKNTGKELIVNDSKTIIKQFKQSDAGLTCVFYDHPDFPLQAERPVRNRDFEYLGFSFNGRSVKLKDGTLSRYYRKMVLGVRREAMELVERYPNKNPAQLMKEAKISQIYQRYGKVDEFEKFASDPKKWTFLTYALRAAKIMKSFDNHISKQVNSHKERVVSHLVTEIVEGCSRRSVKKAT